MQLSVPNLRYEVSRFVGTYRFCTNFNNRWRLTQFCWLIRKLTLQLTYPVTVQLTPPNLMHTACFSCSKRWQAPPMYSRTQTNEHIYSVWRRVVVAHEHMLAPFLYTFCPERDCTSYFGRCCCYNCISPYVITANPGCKQRRRRHMHFIMWVCVCVDVLIWALIE